MAIMLSLALIWQRASRILERLETGATRPPSVARYSSTLPNGDPVSLDIPRDSTDKDAIAFGDRAANEWAVFLDEQKKRLR